METPPNPRAEYTLRLNKAEGTLLNLEKRDGLIVNLRLGVGLIGMGMGFLALSATWFSVNWVAIPLVVFIGLVIVHEKTDSEIERTKLIVEYYVNAMRRIDSTWQGNGCQREDLVQEDHPYAADLDIFGHASLFELLCTARTRAGEETLAQWLTAPADIVEIQERHEAINELRSAVDLREELAILGGQVRSLVHPEKLIRWCEAPRAFKKTKVVLLRIGALCLSVGLFTSFVLWAANLANPLFFWLFVLSVWGFDDKQRQRISNVIGSIEVPHQELLILSLLLDRIEVEQASCPRLKKLQSAFMVEELIASRSIGHLDKLVRLLDAQRNQMLVPILYPLLWRLHLALSIDSWRVKTGHAVRVWLEGIGEYEALCSLACYSFEHPTDPYPEIVEDGPLFIGDELKHPLLPDDVCVPNTVHLDGKLQGWVVSGSNMSGKSTLLRTVGINAVLAFAGAPVRAKRLRISPLSIGATIRLEDSLQAGWSRFYAEINRLKYLMDLAMDERPLLFLLDEILHGTNSQDRYHGSQAIVRSLIDASAIGLVTTHDLALTKIAEVLDGRMHNMHFEDQMEDDRLIFDYKVKSGILKRGNALDLMRSIGLDVS